MDEPLLRSGRVRALDRAFERASTVWLGCIPLMALSVVGVLIWSQAVEHAHRHDACDQPLAFMLRLLCDIVLVTGVERDIGRRCLCYDRGRDGPLAPIRVRVFRWLCLS